MVGVTVRLADERCHGGTEDACQGGMECLAGRCRCPPGARPTADRQHCLRPTEKLLRQPCSPTFDNCLHKSGSCLSRWDNSGSGGDSRLHVDAETQDGGRMCVKKRCQHTLDLTLLSLNILRHLKYVAALLCEIFDSFWPKDYRRNAVDSSLIH